MSEADLLFLVSSQIPEGKTLEYKRDLPDATDGGKVKFLRSITAFANTQGGDLIYGVEAREGLPLEVRQISMPSEDKTLIRLEQLCASGIEPRLIGVQFRFIPLDAGGKALLVRIPRSWAGPHRVNVGGHAQFYGRNAARVYPLDVGELRRAFTLSEAVVDRIRSFRTGRLLAIGGGDAPIPLAEGAKVVLHVIPLQSYAGDLSVDVVAETQHHQHIAPPWSQGWSPRLNLDGRLTYSAGGRESASRSYAQLYRSGVIEACFVLEDWDGEKVVPGTAYEEEIISSLKAYLPALEAIGAPPPFYVSVSIVGVKGYRLAASPRRMFSRTYLADREVLAIPEVLVENGADEPANYMRSSFDIIWNAFGYDRSYNYSADGEWVGE